MRRSIIIRDVITCSRGKYQRAASAFVLNHHLSGNHEGQMTLVAPVIANIRRALFHDAKLDLTELSYAHDGED